MERPKTFFGHRLDFSPPTYCFLLVSIRLPFYSSHLRDSSARGTGPLAAVEGRGTQRALLMHRNAFLFYLTTYNNLE